MQFIITARDDAAEGTRERQAGARVERLARVKELVAAGSLIAGGAITNARGQVTSSVFCEFERREASDRWIGDDIYTRQGVPEAIEIVNLRRMLARPITSAKARSGNAAALKG